MGGDYAPMAPLQGLDLAFANLPDYVSILLIGDSQIAQEYLHHHDLNSDRIKLIHTTQVIEMGESPTKALQTKTDSSIMLGLKMLQAGEMDIFVSAGNTGAVFVGALYTVKAIPGVLRPALSSILPKEDGGNNVILDVGANADCKADVLVQFGILGQIYAKTILDIENPRVGLMNIGSEPEKGNLLMQATYQALAQDERVNFAGNIEGYDLFNDKAEVIVCDGFTGNIVLKTAETVYSIMKRRGLTDSYFQRYDYENYGGTPILGVNKPVMIMHGVSNPQAFASTLSSCVQMVNSHLVDKIKLAFQ